MNAALEMQGVVKLYGRLRALDGLDLCVPHGSIFGLVGSNGAGKTTAMAVALGLLRSGGGQINLLGDGPFRTEKHAGTRRVVAPRFPVSAARARGRVATVLRPNPGSACSNARNRD